MTVSTKMSLSAARGSIIDIGELLARGHGRSCCLYWFEHAQQTESCPAHVNGVSWSNAEAAESEFRSWRGTYGHKFRIVKKHQPKVLNQTSNAPRQPNKARKYSILVEYALISRAWGDNEPTSALLNVTGGCRGFLFRSLWAHQRRLPHCHKTVILPRVEPNSFL
jgi:hypothetical protein